MSRRRQRGQDRVGCVAGGAVVRRPRPPELDWASRVADIVTSAIGSLLIVDDESPLTDAAIDTPARGHPRAEATTAHAAHRSEARS